MVQKNIYVNNCGLDGVNITPETKSMNIGTEILSSRFVGNNKNGINVRGTDLVLKNIVAYLNKESGIKTATLNGSAVKTGKKISKAGSYTLKVTDKAGNTNTVKFKIKK